MKFRKTLASLLAGVSLLATQTKAVTNDCFVWLYWTDDLQSIADNSKPGDVINIKRGDYSIGTFNPTISNDVTITSTDGIMIRGQFNVVGKAKVTFDNIQNSYFGINATDNSSLNVRNCNFAQVTGEAPQQFINFNSTGNVNAFNNYFSANCDFGQAVNIQNYSRADISKNIIRWYGNAIKIEPTTDNPKREANIINNTIDPCYDTAIVVRDNSGLVRVLNNSISNAPRDIELPDDADNIDYSDNNLWQVGQTTQTTKLALPLPFTQGTNQKGTNYSFDPKYLYIECTPFTLSPDSPLWFRGAYKKKLTPWFEDNKHTYIGANGEGMPPINKGKNNQR
jgi:hypothetical protein